MKGTVSSSIWLLALTSLDVITSQGFGMMGYPGFGMNMMNSPMGGMGMQRFDPFSGMNGGMDFNQPSDYMAKNMFGDASSQFRSDESVPMETRNVDMSSLMNPMMGMPMQSRDFDMQNQMAQLPLMGQRAFGYDSVQGRGIETPMAERDDDDSAMAARSDVDTQGTGMGQRNMPDYMKMMSRSFGYPMSGMFASPFAYRQDNEYQEDLGVASRRDDDDSQRMDADDYDNQRSQYQDYSNYRDDDDSRMASRQDDNENARDMDMGFDQNQNVFTSRSDPYDQVRSAMTTYFPNGISQRDVANFMDLVNQYNNQVRGESMQNYLPFAQREQMETPYNYRSAPNGLY